MNICVLSRMISEHAIGGMQSTLSTCTKEWGSAGHKVTIITTPIPNRDERFFSEGVKIHVVTNATPGRYNRAWWKGSVESIRRIYVKTDPDIVISFGGGGWGYAKLRSGNPGSPPLVMFVPATAGMNFDVCLRRPNPRNLFRAAKNLWHLKYWTDRFGRYVNGVIAVSELVKTAVLREYKIENNRVCVVLSGIDTARFSPGLPDATVMQTLGLDASGPLLLWVGRAEKEKGWREALQATAVVRRHFSNVRLIMAAAGSHEKIGLLRKEAVRLGIENDTIIVPNADSKILPELYRAADVFVAPYHGPEGTPLVLMEAMASGTSILASSISAMRSVILQNTDGILVDDYRSPVSLANALISLIEDETLRKKLAINARQRALTMFDQRRMSSEILAVLTEVALSGPNRQNVNFQSVHNDIGNV
jgi:glycosyltransferase involved in cell wall biosynthesis